MPPRGRLEGSGAFMLTLYRRSYGGRSASCENSWFHLSYISTRRQHEESEVVGGGQDIHFPQALILATASDSRSIGLPLRLVILCTPQHLHNAL